MAEPNTIRIAVPVGPDGQIWGHFGKTEVFKMYDITEGAEDIAYGFVETDGQGHGALSELLERYGVSLVICGGIGGGAVNGLAAFGIRVFPGISGDPDQAVLALLNGSLQSAEGPTCGCGGHHDHGEEGCGGHHDHEEGGCGCGGHHDHEEGGCGCGGHHDHEEGGCGCGGH